MVFLYNEYFISDYFVASLFYSLQSSKSTWKMNTLKDLNQELEYMTDV